MTSIHLFYTELFKLTQWNEIFWEKMIICITKVVLFANLHTL